MGNRATLNILWALVAGIAAATLIQTFASPAMRDLFLSGCGTASDIFLRLIKMIIAPLVLALLVSGIAKMDDQASIARVGGKALFWFVAASLISLAIGTAMAIALHPGAAGLILPSGPDARLKSPLSLHDFLVDAVPESLFDALAQNDILQVVVFALLAGSALSAIRPNGKILLAGAEELTALMLKITHYVMMVAPVGVFAAIAGGIVRNGWGMVGALATLLASFYAALVILLILLLITGWLLLGRRLPRLLTLIREPALLAFATTSSEAAFPKLLAGLTRFGVPPAIAGFVLPLGYSFNLDASILYCAFGSLFIAQSYGVALASGQILAMMAMLFVASKGIAAVPRGALIAIAAVIPHFGIPEAGILLLLGVDHFLNMGRSLVNLLGNALAVVAVARWEGALGEELPYDLGRVEVL
jgi:Na+/H+-dicarboxylate symporter